MKARIVRTLTFALAVLAAGAAARAQQRELAGIPLIRNYDVQNDFGGNQVWTILRDRNGLVYVGLTGGNIGQYDGSTASGIPIPSAVTRTLAMDSQGKIRVGLLGNFGYLEPDATGALKYVSLKDKIAPEDRDFQDVWRIAFTPSGTFFQAFEKIFRWDGTRIKVWPSYGHNFTTVAEIDGHIYTTQQGVGLEEIAGDELRPLPGGDALAQAQRVNLLPWDAAHILVNARGAPLKLYDGHTISPFPNEVNDYLKKNIGYVAIPLADGGFCFTTPRGGAVIMDHNGRLRRVIGKESGVPEEGVFAAFEDQDGALWLGQTQHIPRVALNSPVSILSRATVSDSALLNGSLYLANFSGAALMRFMTDARLIFDSHFEVVDEHAAKVVRASQIRLTE